MNIRKPHWEMSEDILFDSCGELPDLLRWSAQYVIFDLTYGNLANECALMAAVGICVDNVLINAVEMVQANMTKAQIINELKSALEDSSLFEYFVSTLGTNTLFDTLVSNVIELHEMYNSEDFFHRPKIEFYDYVTDSFAKVIEAKMKSNRRPAICSYWSEEAEYRYESE